MGNTGLVARKHVSRAQTMLFVTSRQESAQGPVFVPLALLVQTVRICVSLVIGEMVATKRVPRLVLGTVVDVTQSTESVDVSQVIEGWSVNLNVRRESMV